MNPNTFEEKEDSKNKVLTEGDHLFSNFFYSFFPFFF